MAIGRPIGGAPAAGSTGCRVDQIVVSVGPYMLSTARCPDSASRVASAAGKASPPITSWSSPRNAASPVSVPVSASASEGVHCTCVTPWRTNWVGTVSSDPSERT